MRIALAYRKSPLLPRDGMDLIRWHSIAGALATMGHSVSLLGDVHQSGATRDNIHYAPLSGLATGEYDVIFVQTPSVIPMVPEHPFIVCRVGRVASEDAPSRVGESLRHQMIGFQQEVAQRCRLVVVTTEENKERWVRFHGNQVACYVLPNGCPELIPAPPPRPLLDEQRSVVYFGSISCERFVRRLNTVAPLLQSRGMQLFYAGRDADEPYKSGEDSLDLQHITTLGCFDHDEIWDYLQSAAVGIAFATGTELFDSEISKLYAYLRAGLPVVAESGIANQHLVEETGWGAVTEYGNASEMATAVEHWRDAGRNAAVAAYMASTQSWSQRATELSAILTVYAGDFGNG